MKKKWPFPVTRLLGRSNKDYDDLMYKKIPEFVMNGLERYFRIEVEGLEHVPDKGPAVILPNHSGFSGFDAITLAHQIIHHKKRLPRILTHKFWFLTKMTAIPMRRLGFIRANKKSGSQFLKGGKLVVIFPEGEDGNFKPSSEMYVLQEFKRGFVRMAIEAQAPIVPTLVMGAEETHINLHKINLTRYIRGLQVPIPLNLLPLPARWKIIFLPPIELPYNDDVLEDTELMHEIAEDIRDQMQAALNKELRQREKLYF